ncbi:hypothetical protein [Salinibaculum rarum]|uniref:hypothetical protein n=1 Tax=Salinibaculum rarum TaxID=3058903 RepID=UPI00265F4B7B|nr:hypothetical protein [Salinibaculum sp. KK48]
MAKGPTLTRDQTGAHRVQASFTTGRYYFSLSDRAQSFLVNTRNYSENREIAWTTFRTLIVTGDIHLPKSNSASVSTADDLATPANPRDASDSELRELASLLRRGRFTNTQINRLETIFEETDLSDHITADDLTEKDTTQINELRDIARDIEQKDTLDDK